MAASMDRLVHVIANACAKTMFRVPLVANILASRKTLQNCDLLLIYLLLDHTNTYCDLFYSLNLLIGASSKFIWTLIKTNGGGVVRNITSHFRSDSLPSTKRVYKKCLQKMSTKSVYKKCPHLGPSRYSFIVQAHEWAKNYFSFKKRYSVTSMGFIASNKRFIWAAVGAPGCPWLEASEKLQPLRRDSAGTCFPKYCATNKGVRGHTDHNGWWFSISTLHVANKAVQWKYKKSKKAVLKQEALLG